MCTAYKVYVEILRDRMEREVERRKVLSENQGGFRKGRETFENIFVLNHLVS